MSMNNLNTNAARFCSASRRRVLCSRCNEASTDKSLPSSLIAFQYYNNEMRMGNICHTLIMIPQIWNMMLSNGLR